MSYISDLIECAAMSAVAHGVPDKMATEYVVSLVVAQSLADSIDIARHVGDVCVIDEMAHAIRDHAWEMAEASS